MSRGTEARGAGEPHCGLGKLKEEPGRRRHGAWWWRRQSPLAVAFGEQILLLWCGWWVGRKWAGVKGGAWDWAGRERLGMVR